VPGVALKKRGKDWTISKCIDVKRVLGEREWRGLPSRHNEEGRNRKENGP